MSEKGNTSKVDTIEAIIAQIHRLFPASPLPYGKQLGSKETYPDFAWLRQPNSPIAIPYNKLPTAQLLAKQGDVLYVSPDGVLRHCLPAYLLLAARSLYSRKDLIEYGAALDGVLHLLYFESQPEKYGEHATRLHYLSKEQLQVIRQLVHLYLDLPMEPYDLINDEVVDGAIHYLDTRIELLESQNQ